MVNLNKALKQRQEEKKKGIQFVDKTLPSRVNHKELKQVLDIELKYIHENKNQPRKDYEDKYLKQESERKLKELAESIEEKGLIQPVVVFESSNRFFTIIAGHRRYRAFKLLGKNTIPCIVEEFTVHQDDLSERALAENLQREGLNAYEKAQTIYMLRQKERDIKAIEKITSIKERQIKYYTTAYRMVLNKEITKEQLIKTGITLIKSAPSAPQEKNSESKAENDKEKSKSFNKITIKNISDTLELEQALRTIENQKIEVKRLLKKAKNKSIND